MVEQCGDSELGYTWTDDNYTHYITVSVIKALYINIQEE